MLTWFREKMVARNNYARAHERGQRAGERMCEELDAYMQARWYPHIPSMIDKALFGEFEHPEVPPLVVARMDFLLFFDNIKVIRETVRDDVLGAMSEWVKLTNEIEITDIFHRFLDHRVGKFESTVIESAVQKFLDTVEDLKVADDQWRAAHPDKAAKIPVDSLCEEILNLLHQTAMHPPGQ
jgi:hypothetical protein